MTTEIDTKWEWKLIKPWFKVEGSDIDDEYRFDPQREHFPSHGGSGYIDYLDEFDNSEYYTNAPWNSIKAIEKQARKSSGLGDQYDLEKMDNFYWTMRNNLEESGFEVRDRLPNCIEYGMPLFEEAEECFY